VSDEHFSRLKALLLSEDRQQQAQLVQRLTELEATLQALPNTLPQTIEQADQHGPRLGRALLKPVAAALTTLARNDRQLFVSVLFPVIGPIIRRAIADAFSSLLRNLNRTLELSLSWRSWRWRLEARRTGVPFAQVVLKHTLAYRIEHLLWIESGSGLLLAHATNSEAAIADRDAIAGMLTAISDFVRDAVLARAGESLDRVEMGEFSVRLLRTPQAYLAAVVRGEPSEDVLDELRLLSEHLHAELAPEPREYSTIAEAVLADWLAESGQSEALRSSESTGKARRPWLALIALALIVGVLGWSSYSGYEQSQHRQRLRLQIEAQPGITVSALTRSDAGIDVVGQRDPLAISDTALAADLGLAPTQLRTQWQTVHSTEPEILARRLRQRLAAPSSVSISSADGVLRLAGSWPQPPADLEMRLEAYRALLPLDDSALQRGSEVPPVAPVAPLPSVFDGQSWQRAADALQLRFAGGEATAAETEDLTALVRLIEQALQIEPGLRFRIIGSSDGSGAAETNRQLRISRARWLYEYLLTAGIAAEQMELDADGEHAVELNAAARSARIQLISVQ
jgi:outer membrane protein OmpA-like peptidoglycan-associated protein